MNFNNLDLIRFIIDSLIALGCLVLMARLWRRRTRPAEAFAPEPLPLTSSDLQFSDGPTPTDGPTIGAKKREVQRLAQSGFSSTEIARQTGLSKGEVELIKKFSNTKS